jgi:hypothetical protein
LEARPKEGEQGRRAEGQGLQCHHDGGC